METKGTKRKLKQGVATGTKGAKSNRKEEDPVTIPTEMPKKFAAILEGSAPESSRQLKKTSKKSNNNVSTAPECDRTLLLGPDAVRVQADTRTLAASSGYFKAMFPEAENSGFKEAKQREVPLPFIDPETFGVIYNYMCGGTLSLTQENAPKVTVSAKYLESADLLSECCEFTKQFIDFRRCVKILEFSDLYNIDELKDEAKFFIVTNLKEVATNLDFSQLPTPLLTELVQDPAAVLTNRDPALNEKQLFQIVWSSIVHLSEQQKAEYVPELLKAVHLPLIDKQYLKYMKSELRHISGAKHLIKAAKKGKVKDKNIRFLKRYKSPHTVKLNVELPDRDTARTSETMLISGVPLSVGACYLDDGGFDELEFVLRKHDIVGESVYPFIVKCKCNADTGVHGQSDGIHKVSSEDFAQKEKRFHMELVSDEYERVGFEFPLSFKLEVTIEVERVEQSEEEEQSMDLDDMLDLLV